MDLKEQLAEYAKRQAGSLYLSLLAKSNVCWSRDYCPGTGGIHSTNPIFSIAATARKPFDEFEKIRFTVTILKP